MRGIVLDFTKKEFVDALLADKDFMTQAKYLSPQKLTDIRIKFTDPIEQHNMYNTEEVILALVGYAIKRLFYSDFIGAISYNYPFIGELKGGINLNGYRIVSSTDVQVSH